MQIRGQEDEIILHMKKKMEEGKKAGGCLGREEDLRKRLVCWLMGDFGES